MARETTIGAASATLAIAVLLLMPGRAVAAGDPPAAENQVVPPSRYIEDIETPGSTGGVSGEADAAKAQAEAAKAEAEAPSEPASGKQRAAAIATDLIIARPTALLATVAGSTFFALTLPITAPTGKYDEALEKFVKEPSNRLIGPLGK